MIQLSKNAVFATALEPVEFWGQMRKCGKLERFYTAIGLKLNNQPLKNRAGCFVLEVFESILPRIIQAYNEYVYIRYSEMGIHVDVMDDVLKPTHELYKRGKLWTMM